MQHKMCILAAGRGLRLGVLTENINKALLPINGKAVISHIIEKISHDVGIVIAVGYQHEKIMEYMSHAHPDRSFEFVHVTRFDGPGTGPGTSLLACREHLQCPFIVWAADTLVNDNPPPPVNDWMGVARFEEDPQRYCTVQIANGVITQLFDKVPVQNDHAFIGIAGINSYEEFWSALENNHEHVGGEIQLSNGLDALVSNRLLPERFDGWLDTGTTESYYETRSVLEGDSFNFDKINEFTYVVGGRVIKYFNDRRRVNLRVARAKELQGLCPDVDMAGNWFFSYEHVKGETLYECLDPGITYDFLCWAEENVWSHAYSPSTHDEADRVRAFYCDKTVLRLNYLTAKHSDLDLDAEHTINGMKISSLRDLLTHAFNVVYLRTAVELTPKFHGDLQFDNIIKRRWSSNEIDAFCLLDWREDFGSDLLEGDINYDLAKLYGGLTIPYDRIKKGEFAIEESGSDIRYDFAVSNMLNECRDAFELFVGEKCYDLKVISLLRALIFLNMSPLHELPFDRMLYFMGKRYLHQVINSW